MTSRSQKYYGTLGKCVLAVLMIGALCAGADTVTAQTKGKPDQYLKAGIKSLSAGKSKQAIDQLTQAVESGSLSNEDLARALYQRGKAYRANNQQGLAIADLTNALYLKALPKKEQEALHLERARAFSSVGLQGQTSADIRAATGVSATTKPATQNQKPAATLTAPSTTGSTGAASPIVTGSIQQPAPAIAPVPPAPQSGFDPIKSVTNFFDDLIPGSNEPKPQTVQNTTGWQTTQQQAAPAGQPLAVSPKTTGTTATTTAAPTAAPRPATTAAPSTLATNQTGNRPVWMADPTVTTPQAPPVVPLVIHDGTKKAPAASRQTTAAIPTAPKAQPSPVKAAPTPVRKPVTTAAQPAFRQTVPNTYAAQRPQPALKPTVAPKQVAVAPSVAPTQPALRARPKLFQLMVGAGRTEQQARYVWKSLQAAHPKLLSGLTPNIHAKSRPGLGSYYIVGLGPFEDQVKSQKVCDGFKKQRLPCSVVPH